MGTQGDMRDSREYVWTKISPCGNTGMIRDELLTCGSRARAHVTV